MGGSVACIFKGTRAQGYIGDDINCFELLSNVGFPACPSNAIQKIKDIPNIINLNARGGEGVVREFIEKILA